MCFRKKAIRVGLPFLRLIADFFPVAGRASAVLPVAGLYPYIATQLVAFVVAAFIMRRIDPAVGVARRGVPAPITILIRSAWRRFIRERTETFSLDPIPTVFGATGRIHILGVAGASLGDAVKTRVLVVVVGSAILPDLA